MSKKVNLTPEQDEYIRTNYLKVPLKQMAREMNLGKLVVRRRMRELDLTVPEDILESFKRATRFVSGTKSPRKGKKIEECLSGEALENYRKAKRVCPAGHNLQPVGTIAVRSMNKGKLFYQWIKVNKHKWMQLHLHNWMQAGNRLLPGHAIIFKDGDTLNADISNLEQISRSELLQRNSREFKDKLKQGGLTTAELALATCPDERKQIIERKQKYWAEINERKLPADRMQAVSLPPRKRGRPAKYTPEELAQRKQERSQKMRDNRLRKFTPEEDEYIRTNYLTVQLNEMADRLDIIVPTLKRHMGELGLSVPKDVINKRKGRKGMAVGTISIRTSGPNRMRYQFILLDTGWKFLHLYNWLEAGNEFTPGKQAFIFKDGNRLNASVENLQVVERGAFLQHNLAQYFKRKREGYVSTPKVKSKKQVDPLVLAERERKQQERESIRAEKQRLADLKREREREEKRQLAAVNAHREQSKKRFRTPQFKTKTVDYSALISVRVDHKTTIYLRPDQDPAVEIERYKARQLKAAAIK